MSVLYLVATPIGNLEDISARALKVLHTVRRIAAEDTRHTGRLLAHYDIHTPLTSYHDHSPASQLQRLLEELEQGDLALVADAGTPGLNDPGYELVRAAIEAGHTVSPIPGPAAPLAALVASGLPTDAFLYLGYLPRKPNQRRQMLAQIAPLPYTLVLLETPHRLLDSLSDLMAALGDREIAVARELTKLHEEIYRGRISAAHQHFQRQDPRGEFTLVLAGASTEGERWGEARLLEAIRQEVGRGAPPAQIAARLARISGWSRREIYQRTVGMDADPG